MTERLPDRAAIESWIGRASRHVEDDDDLKLDRLTADEIVILAADLEDIRESCIAISGTFRRLLALEPSADSLESLLIDVDLSLRHALWHWDSFRSVLSSRGIIWEDRDDDLST